MPNLRSDLTKLFANTEITYDGFTIPPEGMHVHANVEPVYDESRKSRISDHYTLTVDFVVAVLEDADISTDNYVNDIRIKLTTPAKVLKIKGHGLGNLNIKGVSSDIDGGPRTLSFDWEQLHSNRIARIVWVVEFNLPGCNLGFLTAGDITSFNFSKQWGWDDLSGGLRKQTITGSVGMFTYITANRYFSSLNRAVELLERHFPRSNFGFQRTYDLSVTPDRKTLSFTITDTEVASDTPFPEMMADLQVSQRLSGALNRGNFTEWTWSINASVLVFKPRDSGGSNSVAKNKGLAWIALGRIIIDRLLNAKDAVYYADGQEIGAQLFVESIDVTDYVTSNGFDYSIAGRINVNTAQVFKATGMFQPITGISNTWQQRNQQIKLQEIDAFRLLSDLEVLQGEKGEPIYNICNGATESAIPVQERYKQRPPTAKMVEDEHPTPEKSWREYDYHVRLIDYNETVVNIPLADKGPRTESARGDASTDKEASPVSDFVGDDGLNSANALTEIITTHNPTAKTFRVILSGKARRYGYRINAPSLLSYGGMKPVKIGIDELVEKVSPPNTTKSGKTIREYTLSWRKYYVLTVPDPTKPINNDPNSKKPNPNQPLSSKYTTDVPARFKHKAN